MKITIEISGMKCNGCRDQVKEILLKIKGIKSVDVDLNKKVAVINLDKPIKEAKLKKLFAKTAYNIESIQYN